MNRKKTIMQALKKAIIAVILVAIMLVFPILLVIAEYKNWNDSITAMFLFINVIDILAMPIIIEVEHTTA